jgi:hypothetical protein
MHRSDPSGTAEPSAAAAPRCTTGVKPSARWTANRKKAVLARIARGMYTEADVWTLYGISPEELQEWRTAGVYASKTQKAMRRTKPRSRKPHEVDTDISLDVGE